jgi:hypothetical protein
MTSCPREHYGFRPGVFRNNRPVGGRTPARPGTYADGIANVISGACRRLPNLRRPGELARLEQLIAAGAWADAALVLVELELPAWSLRRLIREDEIWFCSLSRQRNLLVKLDVTADAHHESLSLAILLAFLQARRMAEIAPAPISVTPQVQPAPASMFCCDNFA